MGVYLELVNHDDLFRKSTKEPVIINDLSGATEEDKSYIDNLISMRFNSDLLSNEPSCECGDTKSGYNLGVVCTNCNTPVRELFDQPLEPLVWMRSPKGVSKLINPMVLSQLSDKFSKGGFNIIEWLCNTDYQPSANKPKEIEELLRLNVVRGYNNFVENFDTYIEILFSLSEFKPKKNKEETLQRLLKENRSALMSWYVPFPNRSILIIENTDVGVWIDPILVGAIDAIKTISSIDTILSNFTPRQKENRTAKTLFLLARFYSEVYHDILASKNGLFRKNIFGTREHFTARAVITSNTKAHAYDELHLSWGAAITMFEVHLMNKLIKKNYTPNEGVALLQETVYKYNPFVDSQLKEIIFEAPGHAIPCLFQRNPSLTRASAQRMRITHVKTDPNDPTITLSILSVRGFNADFDGDQMNLTLLNDNASATEALALAPHKNMYDLNEPRTLSRIASIPKPVISTIANWLSHDADINDHDINKQNKMQSIAIT